VKMIIWKLADEHDRTHGGCQWGEGVQHNTSGEGELCGPGWTHWYTHPLLAVMLNPCHGNFDLTKAHLWKGEGTPEKFDHGLKVGCRDGRTIKRVPLPKVSLKSKVRFGILCAWEVYADKKWRRWARNWLSGKDRSEVAAAMAALVAWARLVAWAAAGASAAEAASAARLAASAARLVAWAASAALGAVGAAVNMGRDLDLIALAKKAVRDEAAYQRKAAKRGLMKGEK